MIDPIEVAANLRGSEGDKVRFHVPATRICKMMEKHFDEAFQWLHDRGFDDHFIWTCITRSEVPTRKTIKKHLGNFVIDPDPRAPEVMYWHLRWIFFYLTQLMQGMESIHREDSDFGRKFGKKWTQIPKHFKDRREDFFLHGYLVGMASKYINDPDALVEARAASQSKMASKAGRGVSSPLSDTS